jgi:hypothetical protein
MKKLFLLLIVTLFLISGCSLGLAKVIKSQQSAEQVNSPVANDLEMGLASEALGRFLDTLNHGLYHKTPGYYGGSYDVLTNLNPDIKPDFKQKLWEKFCLANGGVCLNFAVLNKRQVNPDEFVFTIQYFKKDGNLFSTGSCPCSGGGKDEFDFTVKKIDNQFLVISLPPRQSK